MGWLFTQGQTKKGLIKHLIERQENEDGIWETITYCVRGNVFWSVCQITRKDTGEVKKIILCNLMGSDNSYGWGYKDMDEGMGPNYYSCPLKYLDMVPVVNVEWREIVKNYHGERHFYMTELVKNKSQAHGAKVKVMLRETSLKWVWLSSLKPLRGISPEGTVYRLKRKHIGNSVIVSI